MKRTFYALLISALLSIDSFAQSTLAYQWKPNSVYKFKAVQNDKITMGGDGMMGMMAMAGDMEFKTESVFALKIEKTMPNGSATGTFYLLNFKVSDNKGNTLASLSAIPKESLEADFLVDKHGNFTFEEIPMLVCRDNVTLLVSTKVEKGEMATTAEADGEKVTLFAEFNPKTGQLKAGYSAATVGKPKPKPVTVKEDDETLDLIPTDFLDLLVLPEGPVASGKVFKTKMYDTEVTEKVVSFENDVANLQLIVKSALDARKFEKDAKKMAGDEEEDEKEEVKEDMMGGMEMGGMGGNGTPQMSQDMTADIQLAFDNGKGMIQSMKGTITSQSNMMGMEMSQVSKVNMVLVE